MPELPDVAVFKQYIDATSLHQTIADVTVRAKRIVKGTAVDTLKDGLTGNQFESTERWGKYLFIALSEGGCLVMHFGMTGRPVYFKDMAKEPEYDYLLIAFENGYHLAYDIPRKLGAVRLIDDVDAFVAGKGLGPDALSLDVEGFKKRLDDRRGMIKSALMDQTVIAGLGNVYTDEILFQAGIWPRTKLADLDDGELRAIYHAMCDVLNTAIDCHAEPDQFPADWLIPHREQGAECPRCGGKIEQIDVSGRTGYYCPSCQPES